MSLFGNHELRSFDDLLVHEIEELYDAEKRMLKALPKMRDAAHAMALKQLFEAHLAQTLQHVRRLDEVFRCLNREQNGETCQAMNGLLNEGEDVINAKSSPEIRDAALIATAQRMEHHEMASYGTARTFAFELGQMEIAELLQRTLQEEIAADKKLTEIAETEVNARAAE